MRGTLVLLLCLLCVTMVRAQPALEGVLVETYYVSDANDATDVIGGGVPDGSVTYRIFLDLCDGCGLRAIYADANHALSLTSTAPFFNHADRGRSFGHQINNTALGEGTVALDSYMSLGRASTLRLGIPKADDPDGSSVGGTNNDGGSAAISGGLLVNGTAEMGLPLTTSDGLVPLGGQPAVPPSFLVSGDDLDAVFRDETTAGEFVSTDTRIACATPGVQGATPDNLVLIAQLTTTGGLEFRLNVEIEKPDGTVQKYVAPGDTLLLGEEQSGLLVYPPDCGCTDPDFLEYDPAAGCDDGSCATAIVFGCLDPSACNFSSTANFNVPQLCCYSISDCNGLDPYLVCPTIGIEERSPAELLLTPNPTHGQVRISGADRVGASLMIEVMDASGRSLHRQPAQVLPDGSLDADLSGLADGAYMIVLHGGTGRAAARVLKL
ncbi:MAG: T9SS type A sorting domain-containing protein [Flavobacteriales bacterium]|nr:T9SS type A sorting domain-containing protein [Flavobacteriales bacterium]